MLDVASEIRGRLAVFGFEEGLAAGISSEMLDLKGHSDCLGFALRRLKQIMPMT